MQPDRVPDPLHRIVAALQRHGGFDHPAPAVETIETHISVVLLAGEYAYKFKKPVNLGFVDFTSLEKRRFYCEEELRLNRRLAPELYLDVVAIGGDPDNPVPGGEPAIEYCVKMWQFPRSAELDRVVAAGGVEPAAFAALAREVATFHELAVVAAPDSPYGTPARVRRDCMDNFKALGDGLPGLKPGIDLATLRGWTGTELDAREALIAERHRNGRVRECHGDMHLTNMVLLDGRIRVFDCLEFNAGLRWIDVMNEIAFLIMDLDERGHPDLCRIFLNAYLEAGADYAGLRLLRLAEVARAILGAGMPAIVDATFLKHEQRRRFMALAESEGCVFVILDCTAPEDVLRSRVAARVQRRSDASEADIAVLEHQLATAEPLTAEERRAAVTVDTTEAVNPHEVVTRLGITRISQAGKLR